MALESFFVAAIERFLLRAEQRLRGLVDAFDAGDLLGRERELFLEALGLPPLALRQRDAGHGQHNRRQDQTNEQLT